MAIRKDLLAFREEKKDAAETVPYGAEKVKKEAKPRVSSSTYERKGVSRKSGEYFGKDIIWY